MFYWQCHLCLYFSAVGVLPPNDNKAQNSNESSRILLPGEKSPDASDLETSLQRRKRLQDAGIEKPDKKEEKPSFFEKLVDDIKKETKPKKDEKESFSVVSGRGEVNFGPWYLLKNPKNVKSSIPDFSYGFNILIALFPDENSGAGWSRSDFVGLGARFFNGGLFYQISDIYNDNSIIYADHNSAEYGLHYKAIFENGYNENLISGAYYSIGYSPLRWVKANYSAISDAPANSEITNSFVLSWMGIHSEIGFEMALAKTFSAGIFTGVYLASPYQMRLRYGLTIGFLNQSEIEKTKQKESEKPLDKKTEKKQEKPGK